jgi:hypothetical protein
VVLGKSPGVESDQSATCTVAEGAVDLKIKSATIQNGREKTEPGQPPPGAAETALLRQMAEADQEMRRLILGGQVADGTGLLHHAHGQQSWPGGLTERNSARVTPAAPNPGFRSLRR